MVRYLLCLYLLFFGSEGIAQTYTFDYVLETEYRAAKDSLPENITNYVNSKDNSYLLTTTKDKYGMLKIAFIDHDSLWAKGTMIESEFLRYDSFTIGCEGVLRHSNPYKKKLRKNYEYVMLQDTIIDNVAYYHYILKHVNLKKAKRKGIGIMHYIAHKDILFPSPIMMPEAAAVVKWNTVKNIPSRLIKERYFVGPDNLQRHVIKYKSCIAVNKTYINECPIKTYLIISNPPFAYTQQF